MNSDNSSPTDGEFGLEYQIYVLRQMINQLPKDINVHIHKQLDCIVEAIMRRQQIIKKILPQLEDIMLNVHYLEFDRNATAQERDAAIKKYQERFGTDSQ